MTNDKKIFRCSWCGSDPLYVDYHDNEWGVPEHDSQALFEKLILDGFQSGLSWLTILRKRQAFRERFCQFDPEILSKWGDKEIQQALNDSGIIRHRGKIESVVTNARAYLALVEKEGDFAKYLWSLPLEKKQARYYKAQENVPTTSPDSHILCNSLKKYGFRFVGPTTAYAFMQATGMVNDHIADCFRADIC